jgi:hypothetical protein
VLPGDERLSSILQRLLQHSPGARFQSARETRQATLSSVSATVTRRVTNAVERIPLAAAPRVIDTQLKPLADRLSPGPLTMMYAGEDREDASSVFDWVSLAFFSVITVGVLPITYVAMAGSRHRRVLHFLKHGQPAVARIDKISTHKAPFDVPMAKVRFEFEADGRMRRAADVIMPERAERWRDGEDIQVLYDPDRDYSAIIIS